MKKFGLISKCAVLASVIYIPAASAEQYNSGHKWKPEHPVSNYWQAPPEYSGFKQPPENRQPEVQQSQNRSYQDRPYQNRPQQRPARPVDNYSYQGRPPAPTQYRAPQQMTPQPAGPGARSPGNYGAYPPPPPRRPYNAPAYGPDSGASAFYMPGYNQYRRGRNSNKFWGRSGPSRWMNPNKGNLEQGWDDMMNAPSRMGTMPGGWNAPEVSMPNPVDMADQVEENVKDLPDQVRDMDVGNE